MTDLYLASASPRRRELLAQTGVTFEIVSAPVDETVLQDENPHDYVLRLARAKARSGWLAAQAQGKPALPVLGSDTTVALGALILGKPEDAADAAAMLRQLSGSTHQVLTGVALCRGDDIDAVLSVSDVTFATLTEAQIAAYVASGEPMDKAGSYGIQGWGGLFVSQLSGSFTGVMGLPVHETASLLARAGLGHLA
ncbi:septum formation protein [Andreprevotia lacus DSM 23236]|jgi:septum formation protein|uniref:dTTP/UTP pyrophosphatase n=1 Tax=Andreprevotia lacus DSM 23236 TaxID=1121001 RepID=A0A1W1XRF9_9NEIS|nr:Maf family protein [Andreprevotia lacus]SMC26570.1 septum formation protein [Andreprevotia lacus DSM 23236]